VQWLIVSAIGNVELCCCDSLLICPPHIPGMLITSVFVFRPPINRQWTTKHVGSGIGKAHVYIRHANIYHSKTWSCMAIHDSNSFKKTIDAQHCSKIVLYAVLCTTIFSFGGRRWPITILISDRIELKFFQPTRPPLLTVTMTLCCLPHLHNCRMSEANVSGKAHVLT